MNSGAGLAAIALVVLATTVIGAVGLRISRTTSDFYVASRSVSPLWNASAVGGEYLSAASFLGIAALILAYGADMLWLPVGFTGGYLILLVLVAAPLRRSGAYTLPDFTQIRLGSTRVRALSSLLVVAVCWLYLIPQFRGAGLTMETVTGAPSWVGALVVAIVVVGNVAAGGMRSITFVQAFQYWLKLTAILVPAIVALLVWRSEGAPPITDDTTWLEPLTGAREHDLFLTWSLFLATMLGTMGLPHVLVRFYTNPDGRTARRTTLIVIGLVGVFNFGPIVLGSLGRYWAPDLVGNGQADSLVLVLPERMLGGTAGTLLSAVVVAGAFAAFLSTASGLTTAVSGTLAQDVLRGGVVSFRLAAIPAVGVPFALALAADDLPVADVVALAFAMSASTFAPLLVLGIWWRRLTTIGAGAGLLVGALTAGTAVVTTMTTGPKDGWWGAVLAQPAAVTVPLAFATMVVVSLLTPRHVPADVRRTMVRLHVPEQLRG